MESIGNIIKVLSVNVQGLQDRIKRADVIDYMQLKNPDIICLEDTHWVGKNYDDIRRLWPGEVVIHGKKTNSRGVAILFGKDFEYKIENKFTDEIGNLLSLDICTNNIKIKLIVVYAPNNDDPLFFETINTLVQENNHDYALICGDMNLVLNPDIDSYNYKNVNNPNSRKKLIEIMDKQNLVDFFRHCNPNLKRYSWRRTNPIKQARLDYFIGSASLTDLITGCTIKSSYRSDHSILELKILINKFTRNKGRWQLNTSLLTNLEFIDIINHAIKDEDEKYKNPENHHRPYTIDDDLLMEMILMRMRDESIKFSKKMKQKQNNIETKLITEIELLEESNLESNKEQINLKKQILETLREEKIKGAMIRSRIHWLQESEKPTKYFLSLENKNYVDKTIKKIQNPDGKIITDQKEILSTIKLFYEKLFSDSNKSDNETIDENISRLDITTLTPSQVKELEGPLTEKEIAETLKNMKNNKTPGIDGFPADFFKVFWSKLKNYIVQSLNCCYEKEKLSITLRQGIVICLPKGNQPRHFLKNWRPLSMLSVMYKLASGALARRLKSVLNSIISNVQTGFIDGRFIGDTTRLIYDVMHYTEENKIDGLLVSIDFEKAFDSLSWNFLYKTLDIFKFGESFKKWIRILNNDIKAYVMQCGTLSDPILIERGCRQGDPIAPYLFLLPAELLYLLIKENTDIKGIDIEGIEFLFAQFADDTTILLDGTQRSLQATLNTLEIFGSMSGLKMNKEKTKLVWLGRKKHSREKLAIDSNMHWGNTEFTLLGIDYSVELDLIPIINFKKILKSITSEIEKWSRRKLTLIGRITVIKSLLLSKINHLLSFLPNPDDKTTKEIETKLFNYLWDKKPDKIKRDIITKEYHEGGLKMTNINNLTNSIKSTWVRRLLQQDNQGWKQLFDKTICKVSLISKLGSSWLEELSYKTTNPFWRNVFNSYIKVTSLIRINSNQNILDSPLWYNPHLFPVKLHLTNWSKAGIIYIKDIVNDEGTVLSFDQLKTKFKTTKIVILEYYRVQKAVRQFIEQNKRDDNFIQVNPSIPFQINIIYKSKKGTKDFQKIQDKETLEMKFKNKWMSNLNINIDNTSWKNIFLIAHKTIKDNYYRYFQYRIIHRILGIKNLLKKMNIAQDDKCGLCETHSETLEHLFLDCEISKDFLNQLFIIIKTKTKVQINPDKITIIFGYLLKNNYHVPINTILILAKSYLFQCSKKLALPIKTVFIKKLINVYNEQKLLSKIQNRYDVFEKQWVRFIPLLTEN